MCPTNGPSRLCFRTTATLHRLAAELEEAQLPPPHFSQLFCLDMIASIVIFLLTRPSQYYPHTDLYQRLRLGNSDGEFARLATLLGIDAAVNSSDRVFGICNSAIRWCIRDIFAVAQRQGLLRHHAHSEYTLDHWEWCGVTAVWAQPQHRAAVVYWVDRFLILGPQPSQYRREEPEPRQQQQQPTPPLHASSSSSPLPARPRPPPPPPPRDTNQNQTFSPRAPTYTTPSQNHIADPNPNMTMNNNNNSGIGTGQDLRTTALHHLWKHEQRAAVWAERIRHTASHQGRYDEESRRFRSYRATWEL